MFARSSNRQADQVWLLLIPRHWGSLREPPVEIFIHFRKVPSVRWRIDSGEAARPGNAGPYEAGLKGIRLHDPDREELILIHIQ